MNTWKVILATMVIFGAGVITGGVLVRQTALRPKAPAFKQGMVTRTQNFGSGNARLEFLRRAQRELNLSPAQRDRIEQVLKRSQERTRKVMEVVSPRLREELQRTREEFREVLTPEQRAQFDQLLKQQQQVRPRENRPSGREHPAAGQPSR